MARVLTNQTERLVLIRLRSGVVVHLVGGESTGEIDDVEVLDNPQVDVLTRRGVVEVAEPSESSPGSDGGKRSSGGGRKRSRASSRASGATGTDGSE